MQEAMKKGTAVALAAVLLFSSLFPVPLGVRALDDARYGEAHAVAPAVPVIVCTALAACGVYVAGYEMSQYEGNRDSVASSFLSYVAENLYTDDIDAATAAISSAVDAAGNIDLDALAQSGVLGLIPAFASALIDGGKAQSGDSSAVQVGPVAGYGGVYRGYPSGVTLPEIEGYEVAYVNNYNDGLPTNAAMITSGSVPNYRLVNGNYWRLDTSGYSVTFDPLTGEVKKRSFGSFGMVSVAGNGWSYYLVNWRGGIFADAVTSTIAVVESAVLNGEYVGLSGKVEPFEPTAEQLEAGYSIADVVAAIGVVDASLAGVISQVQGLYSLLSPVAGIAQNVQNIRDWWNTHKGDIADAATAAGAASLGIASLVSWAGSTPFGTIMQTVIDGVQGIPDAIAGARDAVVAGVGAIPGAVAGAGQAVLDGVLSIPDALSGVIEGVRSAVLSIPEAIAGVLDGVLAAEAEATYEPVSEGLQLRDELRAQLDVMLDMKAPFCYMRRMQSLASGVAGNFSANPSFYFDVGVPYAGSVRFDAGGLLNSTWGNRTLADYLRILVTASSCAGLLAVSLKLALGRIGSKEK